MPGQGITVVEFKLRVLGETHAHAQTDTVEEGIIGQALNLVVVGNPAHIVEKYELGAMHGPVIRIVTKVFLIPGKAGNEVFEKRAAQFESGVESVITGGLALIITPDRSGAATADVERRGNGLIGNLGIGPHEEGPVAPLWVISTEALETGQFEFSNDQAGPGTGILGTGIKIEVGPKQAFKIEH